MNLRHLRFSQSLGPPHGLIAVAAVLLALAGCNQTVVLSSSTAGSSAASSSAASTTSSSGGASASGGTSTGGSTSGSASGSTSGTGSSGSTTGAPPTFVDGGYVLCTVANGGSLSWQCPAGTYLCDLSGSPGNCFQCRSDADCRNQSLPTYDPLRQRCDLDSGIPGYQSFCQQCLENADCDGNSAGGICDLNPDYPLNDVESVRASSLEPPIETLGFETCQKLPVDCRLDGGPDCSALGELCDPASGECQPRSEGCVTDQDCAGLLTAVQTITGGVASIPIPFCVNGGCNSCDGGGCPNDFCATDADCGNPDSSPAGLRCNAPTSQCECTSSTQCPGFWPVCVVLDGGEFEDGGSPEGVCGCETDSDCGDAGLACLPPPSLGSINSGYCGVPCTGPDFPSCAAFAPGDVCDPVSGLCEACSTDQQCAQDPYAGGPRCGTLVMGTKAPCGCLSDSDCAAGWSCEAPQPLAAGQFYSLGVCTPAMSRCTPSSCGGYFCNWKDGDCVSNADHTAVPSCLDDYDCGAGAFCISGTCAECRTNADCRALGQAGLEGLSATYCCQAGSPDCPDGNICKGMCNSDADCEGNPNGAGCISANNTTQCGCNSDPDCADVAHAPRCDLLSTLAPGTCECAASTDCPLGQTCQVAFQQHSECTSACTTDSDCASGFFCHPSGSCLPRCDPGHSCQAPDPGCDTTNFFGHNGQPDGGAMWCYACIHGDDCTGGLGCDTAFDPPFCDNCLSGLSACGTRVCLDDGVCHTICDGGQCPGGQTCDSLDLVGGGANLCYGCVTSADCPDGEGCDHITHTCGTCEGPTAAGAPSDCPPDAVCSNYWGGQTGVCLQNCDRVPCPADRPLCQTLPSLTPDHAYCFGCLSDSRCSDAGPGAWCDTSVDLTFTCKPSPP